METQSTPEVIPAIEAAPVEMVKAATSEQVRIFVRQPLAPEEPEQKVSKT